MKQVVVGSNNPVKLEATKEAFLLMFPAEQLEFVAHNAPSGVPDQPFGSVETKLGAKNRSAGCLAAYPDADYFVGLEGGLEEEEGEHWAFAWMCVQDKNNKISYGRTGSFLLPPKVSELIKAGQELGHATDAVFALTNSKQKGGTIDILTGGVVDRKDFYREAVIFALIPFIKSELYK